jgi:predicted Zn-dependent protease
LLGISLYEVGEFKPARQNLGYALRLNPGDRNVKTYMARALYKTGEAGAAAQMFAELEREDPQNPELLYSLGLAYLDLVTSTFEKLQKADPNSYLIELLLGKTAEEKQAFAEAIEHYRAALQKAPHARGLHYALGNALWEDGHMPEALQEFQTELQLNPYDDLACAKAALLLVPSDPKEAFSLANRALKLDPELTQALLARGRASLEMGQPAKAVEDLKKVIALDPEDGTVHFQLARAYRQLGMTQEAVAEDAIFQRMQQPAHLPKQHKDAP